MDIQLHHDRVGQLRTHGSASPGTHHNQNPQRVQMVSMKLRSCLMFVCFGEVPFDVFLFFQVCTWHSFITRKAWKNMYMYIKYKCKSPSLLPNVTYMMTYIDALDPLKAWRPPTSTTPKNPHPKPVASVGSLKLLKPKLAAASASSSPISFPGFPGPVSLKPPECNPCSPCGSIFKLLDVGFTIGLVNPIVDVEDVEDVVVNPSSTNFAARVVGFVCFDILGGSVASVASAASVNFVALVARDRADMLGRKDVTTRGLLIKCCQKNVLGFQGKVGEVYFMTPRHGDFWGCSQENFSEASWKMFGYSSWESKMNIVLLHNITSNDSK